MAAEKELETEYPEIGGGKIRFCFFNLGWFTHYSKRRKKMAFWWNFRFNCHPLFLFNLKYY